MGRPSRRGLGLHDEKNSRQKRRHCGKLSRRCRIDMISPRRRGNIVGGGGC